jgi:hypothetical protein
MQNSMEACVLWLVLVSHLIAGLTIAVVEGRVARAA